MSDPIDGAPDGQARNPLHLDPVLGWVLGRYARNWRLFLPWVVLVALADGNLSGLFFRLRPGSAPTGSGADEMVSLVSLLASPALFLMGAILGLVIQVPVLATLHQLLWRQALDLAHEHAEPRLTPVRPSLGPTWRPFTLLYVYALVGLPALLMVMVYAAVLFAPGAFMPGMTRSTPLGGMAAMALRLVATAWLAAWVGSRLLLAPAGVIARGWGATEALRRSWAWTRGRTLKDIAGLVAVIQVAPLATQLIVALLQGRGDPGLDDTMSARWLLTLLALHWQVVLIPVIPLIGALLWTAYEAGEPSESAAAPRRALIGPRIPGRPTAMPMSVSGTIGRYLRHRGTMLAWTLLLACATWLLTWLERLVTLGSPAATSGLPGLPASNLRFVDIGLGLQLNVTGTNLLAVLLLGPIFYLLWRLCMRLVAAPMARDEAHALGKFLLLYAGILVAYPTTGVAYRLATPIGQRLAWIVRVALSVGDGDVPDRYGDVLLTSLVFHAILGWLIARFVLVVPGLLGGQGLWASFRRSWSWTRGRRLWGLAGMMTLVLASPTLVMMAYSAAGLDITGFMPGSIAPTVAPFSRAWFAVETGRLLPRLLPGALMPLVALAGARAWRRHRARAGLRRGDPIARVGALSLVRHEPRRVEEPDEGR